MRLCSLGEIVEDCSQLKAWLRFPDGLPDLWDARSGNRIIDTSSSSARLIGFEPTRRYNRAMLAIPLDTATEARLASAAARLGEEPHALAARAVGSYLEDLEDYARAAEAWAELDPASVKSLEDMKHELGLAG